jgi:oxygen-dependent protoporphyrinogen oxidase
VTRRVVVVGGGITGLATAWLLRHGASPVDLRPGEDIDVTVLEGSDRLGGKIATGEVDGVALDVGADAFLARRPEAERLVRRLGLADDLVAPATGQVWLWVRGRLRPLPAGTVLGVPSDLGAVARSGTLSPWGWARAAMEPLLPRRRPDGDRSVRDLVAGRFGGEVADTLVEPLLGGIYAGRIDQLSLAAAAAPIDAVAARPGSLHRGLRRHRAGTAADDRPVFLTVTGGLGRVVDRLAADLDDVRTGVTVTGVAPRRANGAQVELSDGGTIAADDVVVTVPAFAAASILAAPVPDAARLLAGIRYASVAVVTLAYPAAVADRAPHGSGMLVPRTEGRLVKAATWSSRKWPHLADGDRFLLRASVGRVDDDRATTMSDDELTAAVTAEVAEAMGIAAAPTAARVTRWERGLPQYEVDHQRRVAAIRDAVRIRTPSLHLVGAAYDGLGLAPCIAQAEEVVRRLTVAARDI